MLARSRPSRASTRARPIDGDHANCLLLLTNVPDESRDEARLADSRGTRDADGIGPAGLRIELAHDFVCERIPVLDQRDRARKRAPVTLADALHERLAGPLRH